MQRRTQLAMQSFRGLQNIWKYPHKISESLRVQSYKVIVESILLYNCGTWALTVPLADRLDRVQRKMLRCVLGLKWYDKVTNDNLYARCGIEPASVQVVYARWRLFGHTLRLGEDTPARKAMVSYFDSSLDGRRGNFITIATALSREYKATYNRTINTRAEYDVVQALAQDRDKWKNLVADVVDRYCEHQVAKIARKADARKARNATVM